MRGRLEKVTFESGASHSCDFGKKVNHVAEKNVNTLAIFAPRPETNTLLPAHASAGSHR